MYLIINDAILPHFIALVKNDKVHSQSLKLSRPNVLVIIDKILNQKKAKIDQLKGVIIISDGQSFSQSRIYATIANILGLVYGLPRVFIKSCQDESIKQAIERAKKSLKKKNILPIYNKEPNITKVSKRPNK
jgi:hypothetical protein